MIFMKTIFFVKYGKFPDWLQKKMTEVLDEQEGKRVLITIETEKKQRSGNENRYYWGVVLPLIHSMIQEAGNTVTREDVHEYLKLYVGRLVKDIHDPDGEAKPVTRSSSDLTTKEWEDWMTNIRAWAAPFGVQVPFPNELTYVQEPNYGQATA